MPVVYSICPAATTSPVSAAAAVESACMMLITAPVTMMTGRKNTALTKVRPRNFVFNNKAIKMLAISTTGTCQSTCIVVVTKFVE
jgi:hypothetical protein